MFGEQPQIGARRGPFDVWHGRFLAITYAAFHRDLLKNESGGRPKCFPSKPLHGSAGLFPGNRLAGAMSSGEISFTYLDGKVMSGRFEVERGIVTVTTSDGRLTKASIEDSMLAPETLAKVLLLQLYKNNNS